MTKTAELGHLFRALKAPAAARAVPKLAERAREEEWSHERFLEAVLSTEVASRESHGGENRIKAARLPARKTLEEFDFTGRRSVKKQVVEHLGQLDFLHGRENVVLLGPPGTGKTHLAIAIGIRACLAGQRVQFATATEWVARLGEAKRSGDPETELRRLSFVPLISAQGQGPGLAAAQGPSAPLRPTGCPRGRDDGRHRGRFPPAQRLPGWSTFRPAEVVQFSTGVDTKGELLAGSRAGRPRTAARTTTRLVSVGRSGAKIIGISNCDLGMGDVQLRRSEMEDLGEVRASLQDVGARSLPSTRERACEVGGWSAVLNSVNHDVDVIGDWRFKPYQFNNPASLRATCVKIDGSLPLHPDGS